MRRCITVQRRHWNTIEIVGVSDSDPSVAERVGNELGVPGYVEPEQLLARRPDFAFAFGPHADMPALGRLLVDADVPFVSEKPASFNSDDVAVLRDRAHSRGCTSALVSISA